jgi:hypothetical protein
VSIRWKRSSGDYVESHDGEWFITPLYCGCTRPQAYELRHNSEYTKSLGEFQNQRQAKEEAEDLKKKWASTVDRKP